MTEFDERRFKVLSRKYQNVGLSDAERLEWLELLMVKRAIEE